MDTNVNLNPQTDDGINAADEDELLLPTER
jgi:hypothetical protein